MHQQTIPLMHLCKVCSVMIRRVKAVHTNTQHTEGKALLTVAVCWTGEEAAGLFLRAPADFPSLQKGLLLPPHPVCSPLCTAPQLLSPG